MLSSVQRVLRTFLSTSAVLAVVALLLPNAARAQADECNGLITINYPSGPQFAIAGDTYRVRIRLGTDSIIGGTANELTVDRFRFALDCSGGGSVPCTDEGDIIRYVGDGTITSSGCFDANPVAVTWSSNGVDGPAGPNEVVFTPSAPVVIPADTAPSAGCEVQFDVRVENTPGLDASPLTVQEAVGYVSGDATCDTDPVLNAVTGQTGQIRLCPACDDGECFDQTCNQTTGICEQTNEPESFACGDTDGTLCTIAGCDGAGTCVQDHETVTCADGECFNEACNPTTGVCDRTNEPDSFACGDTDGTLCTIAGCDGAGTCVQDHETVTCTDGECFNEECNPTTGVCDRTNEPDSFACGDTDGTLCTIAGCDGAGTCVQEHETVTCTDGECFNEACNPTTGVCDRTNEPDSFACGDTDGTLCTIAGCDGAGTCVQDHETVSCTDGECFNEECNPATGVCDRTNEPDSTECTDSDGDLCTTAGCDGAGNCVQTHVEVVCEDPECERCDPSTGECVDRDPLPLACGLIEVCRTPGFWATHAGVDPKKKNSQDITGAVLAAGGPILVCGTTVTNSVDAMTSMCVSPQGDQTVQLERQLVAAALNCILSGGGADCNGVSIDALWNDCNAACQGLASTRSVTECIGAIDCFNNGGVPNNGTCDVALESCHERDLCPEDEGGASFCFEPPGPAGSSKQCNDIKKD